jgi:NAD(P)-dependent dehydrogenase (short-subunit alcohol dehydrogenase family)
LPRSRAAADIGYSISLFRVLDFAALPFTLCQTMGKPRAIGAAVCYLASPLAGYVNGTSIRVDGGAAHYF